MRTNLFPSIEPFEELLPALTPHFVSSDSDAGLFAEERDVETKFLIWSFEI